ncbi:MAG TPA: response regulator transcription factor [Candidatus Fimimorpha faecalis]|mgnify:CR=1 FL=1|uniref:Stage 0 sporulation protein A homolog n=1 Tax=Candidatus Fimimorpha faecalis TaxID=2840824 RepID=A0A9D1ECX6_9FIRM|nr:response regulator transcription factor [Candidatus Fimimorpha faecalis]
MGTIYVIEDEINIRDLIKIALEGFGYQVSAWESAEEALEAIKEKVPDLMIFDRMLPGMDGVTAIQQIRSGDICPKVPIMILTAKDKEIDKVCGLDGGADDYMTKPFGILELAARVRSLLRRSNGERESEKDIVTIGRLEWNFRTREVWFDKKLLELTYKEYELLQYLWKHQDRVVSREELLDSVWGYEYDGETRTLDIHVRTLRQKLGESGQEYIKTVRGVGYRFVGGKTENKVSSIPELMSQ